MKALLLGDVHLSDTPPSVRTDSYAQDILDKLKWCVEFANAEDVDCIIQLGDMFHIKTPSRTSHRLVQATAKVLEQAEANFYVVPGNHDMQHDRLESLSSQPLGALALSPNVEVVDGLHWIHKFFAIPYTENLIKLSLGIDEAIKAGANLIVTHASIFPPELHPPYDHITADKIRTQGIPLAYGHIHDQHGFYLENGTWFCNNGAISRGSLHEETLKRHPEATLFDSEFSKAGLCPFKRVPIPHKPAEEVFKLVEHQAKQEKAAKLDDFLDSVGGVTLQGLSVEEVVNHAETSNLLDSQEIDEMKDIIETVS